MEKKKKGLFGGLFKANDCSCGVTIVEEPETRKNQGKNQGKNQEKTQEKIEKRKHNTNN